MLPLHPFFPRSPCPERHRDTPPAQKTEALFTQQRPVERRSPKHNSKPKNASSFSAAGPWRWSPEPPHLRAPGQTMQPLRGAAHTHEASRHAGPCSSAPSPTHHIHRDSGKEFGFPSRLATEYSMARRKSTGDDLGVPKKCVWGFLSMQGGTPKHTPRAGVGITRRDNRDSASVPAPAPGHPWDRTEVIQIGGA